MQPIAIRAAQHQKLTPSSKNRKPIHARGERKKKPNGLSIEDSNRIKIGLEDS